MRWPLSAKSTAAQSFCSGAGKKAKAGAVKIVSTACEIYFSLCVSTVSRKGLLGRTIHPKLRYDNFSSFTSSKTLPGPIDDTATIYRIIESLFKANYQK